MLKDYAERLCWLKKDYAEFYVMGLYNYAEYNELMNVCIII